MNKIKILQKIIDEKLVAVVRTNTYFEAIQVIQHALVGGLTIIEITMTTPQALQVIEEVKKTYNQHIIVGAGSVLDSTTARQCILAGADFIVSPHIDTSIIEICHLYQVPVIPGASDIKDVIQGLKLGCDIIKLFPANLLGVETMKAFKGPVPQASFIPTGGINLENITNWLNAGAVAVGIGAELTKEALQTGDYKKITEYEKKLVDIVDKWYRHKPSFS